MIKIENIDIYGWEAAIRGMRNPMNSWEKSDSGYGCGKVFGTESVELCDQCFGYGCRPGCEEYIVGTNDLDLMTRLAKAGSVHAKFRRMINVTMDITAPLYWWKEFDTYKVGTVANSCSTMHKIQAKEFTLEDFSCEHLFNDNSVAVHLSTSERGDFRIISNKQWLMFTCDLLNDMRTLYLQTKDKHYWWQMIQLLPSSYNQKRTVQLNYEVLSHLYFDRKGHKLDEWRTFCETIRELPYAKEIITMED